MLGVQVICGVLCAFVEVTLAGDAGPNQLDVMAINKCERDNYKFKFDLKLIKINETHDGVCGDIIVDEEFTEAFGVRIELCRKKDDKWKKFQVIADDSLYNLWKNIAGNHLRATFEAAGMTEPPVAKGTYHIDECAFSKNPDGDYMCGSFKMRTFVMEGDEEVGCMEYEFDLTKPDDE